MQVLARAPAFGDGIAMDGTRHVSRPPLQQDLIEDRDVRVDLQAQTGDEALPYGAFAATRRRAGVPGRSRPADAAAQRVPPRIIERAGTAVFGAKKVNRSRAHNVASERTRLTTKCVALFDSACTLPSAMEITDERTGCGPSGV